MVNIIEVQFPVTKNDFFDNILSKKMSLADIANELYVNGKITDAIYKRACNVHLNMEKMVNLLKKDKVGRREDLNINDDWSLIDIINNKVPKSWENVFETSYDEIQNISYQIDGGIYLPAKRDIFRAFEKCSLNKIKVVILGQDPYHSLEKGSPIAMGLSFSVRKEFKVPPSLKNVYKELKRDIKGFEIPDHGDLSSWLDQGVFLLNTCLTVEQGKAKSHGKIWSGFINTVLNTICEANPNVIFVLWGREAESFKSKLQGTILEAGHPSPLNTKGTFTGCSHFSKINNRLIELGDKPIDWSL